MRIYEENKIPQAKIVFCFVLIFWAGFFCVALTVLELRRPGWP